MQLYFSSKLMLHVVHIVYLCILFFGTPFHICGNRFFVALPKRISYFFPDFSYLNRSDVSIAMLLFIQLVVTSGFSKSDKSLNAIF